MEIALPVLSFQQPLGGIGVVSLDRHLYRRSFPAGPHSSFVIVHRWHHSSPSFVFPNGRTGVPIVSQLPLRNQTSILRWRVSIRCISLDDTALAGMYGDSLANQPLRRQAGT